MPNHDALLENLKKLASAYDPSKPAEVDALIQQLETPLPPLLRDIFYQIGPLYFPVEGFGDGPDYMPDYLKLNVGDIWFMILKNDPSPDPAVYHWEHDRYDRDEGPMVWNKSLQAWLEEKCAAALIVKAKQPPDEDEVV